VQICRRRRWKRKVQKININEPKYAGVETARTLSKTLSVTYIVSRFQAALTVFTLFTIS